MRFKRLIASAMVAVLAVSVTACGGKDEKKEEKDVERSEYAFEEERDINIGVYQDMYYDSSHSSVEDNPNVTDRDTAQMQLDHVRDAEEKFNCKFYYKNLTWEGIIDSINTSIMSGSPDCDIYDCSLSYGLPAILNGQAQALEDFIEADNDVFTDMKKMQSLNLLDMDKTYFFASSGGVNTQAWGLCFNMDIVCKERGLENPQDVYDRGEWTWDKWEEYLDKCTFDRDGDGTTDVYGYGSVWTQTLNNLLMSNNTGIATSEKQSVDSKATMEVLTFIENIYNVKHIAKPWDDSDYMQNGRTWQDGLVAFWAAQHWMLSEGDIFNKDWELGIVPWPTGPSGNKDTNPTMNVGGDWDIIPQGIENPRSVYEAYAYFRNWWGDDATLVSDTTWAEDCFMTERNFNYIYEMSNSNRNCVDLWENLDSDFSLQPMLLGEETSSQLATAATQYIQSKLDSYLSGNVKAAEPTEEPAEQ